MAAPRPSSGVHRIIDRPEDHEAPGACEWDRAARRRLDDAAALAAQRFLVQGVDGAEGCWRCETAPAATALGLCQPCLGVLRSS